MVPWAPGVPLDHGVVTTTWPFNQGVTNSIGMALAPKWYQTTFNRVNFMLFDFDVYALAGDGCLQEVVSAEAASLARHLKPLVTAEPGWQGT